MPEQPPENVTVVVANARPSREDSEPKVIDAYARMLPTIMEEAPILTLEPTDHQTFED